ncbi:MAG: M15 family metallopeptidase [Bacteroidota bacterium]
MRNLSATILWVLCVLLVGCSSQQQSETPNDELKVDTISLPNEIDTATLEVKVEEVEPIPDTSEMERALIEQGLINILSLDTSVRFDVKYSTTDNFLNEDVYGDFAGCYLQPAAAERLVKADSILQSLQPKLRFLLHDCVRPRSVQYKMWEIVKGTDQQNYVAFPGGSGSIHNYGAAVDLSLVHIDTGVVDMGTVFDFFGDLAQPRYEEKFVKEGKLRQVHVDNRRILRTVMLRAGFHGILNEWWHFNAFPREEVKKRFKIVE